MNPTHYFQSYEPYFWRWEEDAEVLALADGSTIAYTEEILKTLAVVAENGLPPFGVLLLVNVAINSTEGDALSFIENRLTGLKIGDVKLDSQMKAEAFQVLRLLQSMPQEYKTGQRRQMLFQAIFENTHNRVKAATSRGIVNFLKEKKNRSFIQIKKALTPNVFMKDVQILMLLSRKFKDVQSIIKAIEGLPELEDEQLPLLETKTVSETTYKDFVEELMDNPQTFQVGALIKPIWAGFKIPIFNAHPSEQPLGGVSDLSNKGSFDKLLISEFANDDLVFMSRLANNEALYLQREMPPVTDKLQRIILIDISLKAWGIPKILAHASSLAISKHPASKSESNAFVVGDAYHPMSYEKTDLLVDGLQKVAVGLNAHKGIEMFLKEHKNSKQLEIFYITTTDGLKYPEINKILAEHHALFKYLITTNAEGDINFYRNRNNAFKHLQTIKLPLERLWKKPVSTTTTKPLVKPPLDHSPPILLSILSKKRLIVSLETGEMYLVANNCLFRCVNRLNEPSNLGTNDALERITQETIKSKGCELVLSDVPTNGIHEIGEYEDGGLLFLVLNYINNHYEITITNLNTFKHAKLIYTKNAIGPIIFSGGIFSFSIGPVTHFLKPNFDTQTIEIEQKEGHHNTPSDRHYNDRQKEINCFKAPSFSILKNITEVYINQNNFLVFNKHQLQIGGHNNQFFTYQNLKDWVKIKYSAEYNEIKKTFIFNDGSEIIINSKSFFILKSSDKQIPTIYLPSNIDVPIGIATQTHFAGSNYFYAPSYLTFLVKSKGDSKSTAEAAQIINRFTGIDLSKARRVGYHTPPSFSLYMDKSDAESMKAALLDINWHIDFTCNREAQTIIPASTFYDAYILKFINQILQHESNN
jgi:hypothetical protein